MALTASIHQAPRAELALNWQALVTMHLDRQEVPLLMAHLSTSKVPLPSMCLLLWVQKCLCTVKVPQVDPCLNGSLPLGGHKVFRPLVQWHHGVALHSKAPRIPVGSLPQQYVLANFPLQKKKVADTVACLASLKVPQLGIALGPLHMPSVVPPLNFLANLQVSQALLACMHQAPRAELALNWQALVTVHLDRQEVPLLMAHLCGCKVPLACMPLWMQKCTVQAAPSGPSLSPSQSSQWQPSRWSKGFQTSGTVASQISFPSQGSKAPSKFSTLTSAASPGHFASTQEGSGKYSGLFSLSQGTSSQYSPGSSGYTKLAASPLGVSQSTRGHGSYRQYTSSSQSRAGTQLAGSSHYAPGQTGSTFTDGSSLHLQGTSTQYVPTALGAKVPVYRQSAPSRSLSLSQTYQWQPSSRWSQGFQTSGTVASRSSSPFQGSKIPVGSLPQQYVLANFLYKKRKWQIRWLVWPLSKCLNSV